MAEDRTWEQKVAALRAALDALDEQTRRPGEPPLREAVAQQARERLAEMDAEASRMTTMPGHSRPGQPRTDRAKPDAPPRGPSGVSPSLDGSR